MISFESDYTTGAHPKILERFVETNMEALPGYGSDLYTEQAIEKIKKECNNDNAMVYLAVGGTETNQLVIASMLKSYEGVVAANTGHVSVHEAGAIEHSGHKVLTIPSHMGKIDANELREYVENFYSDENHEHMVYPGMVYISYPTEYGSLYSKAELKEIAEITKKYNMTFYIDGARLGYGLISNESDVTMEDIAEICDVFYIGGTKVGALCGEAIVFTKNNMPKHFITIAKQKGDLLAKGRLLGIQFDTLFTNGLYYENAKNAISKKERLIKVLKDCGLKFYYESPTNQQFVIIDNDKLNELTKEVAVSYWEKYDESHTVIRFATSWSTTDSDINELSKILDRIMN